MTDIVNLSNGRDARNARWRSSRRSYDAGSGVRSSPISMRCGLLRGALGRALRVPLSRSVDHQSGPPGQALCATDQVIGTGEWRDGELPARQDLCRCGRFRARTIAKPVAGSVRWRSWRGAGQPRAITVDTATGRVIFGSDYIPAGRRDRAGGVRIRCAGALAVSASTSILSASMPGAFPPFR